MAMEVETLNLTVPALVDVANALQSSLQDNFDNVEVRVVDCPDLTQAPYRMAAKGLGGSPRIADVGGPKYLAPLPQLERKYDLEDIAKLLDLREGCLMFGAGAGPYDVVGCNCELMANLYVSTSAKTKILSQTAKLDKDENQVVQPLSSGKMAILGNFFACEGKSGPVLEIKAAKRSGQENFVTCMQKGLAARYPGISIGIGGVFLVPKGKVNIHVMPDFSKQPLKSDAEVDKWLHYFDFPGPMVFFSEFVTHDPGLDLRVEHTHGHSILDENNNCQHNYGGHYHYDVTPEEIEYVGYFNVAEVLYRIDRPKSS